MEDVAVWITSAIAVVAVVVAAVMTFAWRASVRQSEAAIAELRRRVDDIDPPHFSRQATNAEPAVAEFLITDAGLEHAEPQTASTTLVLSSTVGEPLVKAVSFAYGLRHALTPENRDRVRFAMRRELRRRRKARKAARRGTPAAQSTSERSRVAS